jgi:hypothetical protein
VERILDRIALQDEKTGGNGTRVCEVGGCLKATRQGKPWCQDHTHIHSPEAQRITRELAQREWEIERIKKKLGVVADGFLVREARRVLSSTASTAPGLARDLSIPSTVAEAILRHLVRAGVGKRRSIRGKYAVSLNVKAPG